MGHILGLPPATHRPLSSWFFSLLTYSRTEQKLLFHSHISLVNSYQVIAHFWHVLWYFLYFDGSNQHFLKQFLMFISPADSVSGWRRNILCVAILPKNMTHHCTVLYSSIKCICFTFILRGLIHNKHQHTVERMQATFLHSIVNQALCTLWEDRDPLFSRYRSLPL